MAKTNKKNEKEIGLRRKAKKEAERRRRERIKNDPQLYEEAKRKERERYHERKNQGKVKLVSEMSARMKRAKRKTWKDASKKYREYKKKEHTVNRYLEGDSPPPSPTPDLALNQISQLQRNVNGNPCKTLRLKPDSKVDIQDEKSISLVGGSSRKSSGRKKVRKAKASVYRKNKKLELELRKYKSKYNRYKSKYYREINKKTLNLDSPNTKVKVFTKGLQIPKTVKRKLLFNEVLITQMKQNYRRICKKKDERKNFLNCVAGKVLKKYKCLHFVKETFSCKYISNRNALVNSAIKQRADHIRNEIEKFLEEDSNSILCPGKKDTVTHKKCRKQKRYLSDNMKNLHKVFCSKFPQFKVGYSTFCKQRPFSIVQRKAFQRDTCLCTSHENMKFMVSKLKHLKVISEGTSKELLESICCEDSTDLNKCLERRCNECKDRQITINHFCKEDSVSFEKWVLKKEIYITKGKTKTSKKYSKDVIKCCIGDLVEELNSMLPQFMQHVSNIIHQHRELKKKKEDLKFNEALVHMDFSENYECKYSEEIQGFHFGGSREQVSIHTVMVYYKTEESDSTISKAFSTLSNSLNHDAMAICVHLRPVLEKLLCILPTLSVIHFVSDGPSTQYRNRKMFYLMATYLPSILPTVDMISWNYSEAGHGKGAPDGLGGTIKRTADQLIAQGKDVNSYEKLFTVLQTRIQNIEIISVSQTEIQSFYDETEDRSITFKGTMKVHQVIWCRIKPGEITFRRLSCFLCSLAEKCEHYEMGTQKLKNVPRRSSVKHSSSKKLPIYNSIYTDSEEEDDKDALPYEDLRQKPMLPKTTDSLLNSYVVATFQGKKSNHHYVGLAIKEEDNELGKTAYLVKFLRKKVGDSFSFHPQNDQCLVDLEDIVQVLREPTVTRRQTYLFKDLNVANFANLK